jgi:hypothetical protein
MSVKLFYGFDHQGDTSNAFAVFSNSSMTAAWAALTKPRYLFHNNGVATLSQTVAPPAFPGGTTSGGIGMAATNLLGGSNGGKQFWAGKAAGISSATSYTGATTVTRATAVTAKGFQIGIVRNRVLPSSLSANEYWFSFEVTMPQLPNSSLSSSHSPTLDWQSIFRWGDVQIKFKQTTYISGGSSDAIHDVVFAVMNNGVEVATITCPSVSCLQDGSTTTSLWCLVHVKLHASTGLIEAAIAGNAQSASYTGQNTVQTIAEADATAIYFSGCITDDGTTMRYGGLDSILVDDAEFPVGRPIVRLVTLLADDTLTDAAAAGTSPTTVVNALSSPTDPRQLRFSSSTGRALMTNTMPSTAGLNSTVLGFQGAFSRASNRYPLTGRRMATGLSLSSVDAEDEYFKNEPLPFSSIITPPETTGLDGLWSVYEKGGGGKFATSDLASIKTYIRSVP